MDTQKAIIGLFSDKNDDAAKAAIKDEFVKESIPKLAKYVELRSGKGKNGYIVGSALSLADLAVFNFVDQTGGLGLVDAWNKYPVIKNHQEKVKSEKKVAEWLKKRQEYEQK
ncbi:uncharacterized protein LOC128218039 [Mya arenaria]|uniref:uncharacterized protein LOC128218039 n=1 Tax=Mya arenaria TaxID=6604 RepID=UPI0022E6C6D6|nr:uncharacterized protein LOC128218039 [Mya arenaria]